MQSTSHSKSGGGAFLRILCLHDDESHAMELSDSLEVMGERLFEKHGIDLVYVNSPLISRKQKVLGPQELPNRVWWEEQEEQSPRKSPAPFADSPWKDDDDDDDDGDDERSDKSGDDPNTQEAPHSNASDKNLVGLDASLLLLKQVWNSMPFWGILAIGKGAAVGSFLPLMGLSPEPSFCCFVHGEALLEETERLIDSMPCLHIVGEDPGPSETLFRQFGGEVHLGPKKLTKSNLNTIGKFVVGQKKRLRIDSPETNILALQNQLYMVEQEAASIVAERIAADPPKALMAIIQPQKVGGWSDRKRMGKKEGGGGAPCPSEFLLKKKKRTTNPDGPTRNHPNDARNIGDEEEEEGEEKEEEEHVEQPQEPKGKDETPMNTT
ncbi:MAG: hypothetical protein SGBAC_010412 [Bacillariaceae sp.]